MLKKRKILITGVTGLIARPIALLLAKDNEVWGLSLFGENEAAARAELEAAGVHCIAWNMATDDFPETPPADVTHVIHTAMLRETQSYDAAIDVNGVACAKLMTRFKTAEAFFFISSTAIYKHLEPDHRHKETDPLGGGLVFIPAYQVSKIAAEAVVRALATLYDLPTVIIRPGVCYGPGSWGGVPVSFLKRMLAGEAIERPDFERWCAPIHVDDIARFTPTLLQAAAVPATIVNMAGDEPMTFSQMLGDVAAQAGEKLTFKASDYYHDMYLCDNAKREAICGPCRVSWRDGLTETLRSHFPNLNLITG